MNTESTKHKRYDEAFKRPAVEHWMVSGRSATQIARALGINVQKLHKWKQKFKALPAGQVAGNVGGTASRAPTAAKGTAPGGAAARHSKKTLGIISAPNEPGL